MTYDTNTELIYQYQHAKPKVETKWAANPLKVRNKNYVLSNIQGFNRKRQLSKNDNNKDIDNSVSPNNMFDSCQTTNIVFNPNLSNSSPIGDNYSFVCLNAGDKAMSPGGSAPKQSDISKGMSVDQNYDEQWILEAS